MRPIEITSAQWRLFNRYFLLEHFIGINNSKKFLGAGRNKLYGRIAQNEVLSERGGIVPIDTIDCRNGDYTFPSREELGTKPFLFKGAAAEWQCMKTWTESFFREQLGDYSLDINYNLGFSEDDVVKHQTDMASFIKQMKEDKSSYLRFCRIIEDKPELKADLDLDFIHRFQFNDSFEEYYFFMGEAGTKTGLHTEVTESLAIQISGEKKWILFAPEERIFFNPLAKRFNHFLTHADPENIDDKNFPLLRYAKRYEVTMKPGDVLWFPSFYWHYVRNITHSIGIAYKHLDLNHAFSQSRILTTLFFLRTHPTIVNPFSVINNIMKKNILKR